LVFILLLAWVIGVRFMPVFAFLRKSETAETKVQKQSATAQSAPISQGLPTGNETVLVADDEPAVREVMAVLLKQQGYRVVEAADGEIALRRCQDKAQKIDLVIADILMPNMTGKRLAYRLGQACPQTKVILCSGCPERLATRTGMIDASIPFLKKPVSDRDLALKVREVLDSPKAKSDWQEQLEEKDCSHAEFTAGMAGTAITPSPVSDFTDYQV
jgi:CheY-like chemotaxis protein